MSEGFIKSNSVAIYVVWSGEVPMCAFPILSRAKAFVADYAAKHMGIACKITKLTMNGDFVVSDFDKEHMAYQK